MRAIPLVLVFATLASLASSPSTEARHLPCAPEDCPVVVPPPDLPFVSGGVALQEFAATVVLGQGLADVALRIGLANHGQLPAEAAVAIPIPHAAALWAFNLTVDGQVLEGHVTEKGQARLEYEAAKQQGRDAVLLERAEDGLLQLSVHVPAGAERLLQAAYAEPLESLRGEWVHRLPLSRLEGRAVGSLALDYTFTDAGVQGLRFAGPPVTVTGSGTQGVLASLRQANAASLEDAVAVWSLEGPWSASLAAAHASGATQLLATVCLEAAPVARDVVFVIDRSGSMEGQKMVEARAALQGALQALRPDDRFAVVAFDDLVETLTEGMVPGGGANVRSAVSDVGRVDAMGSTDIDAGLQQALAMLAGGEAERPAMVVVLTDGMPTSGVRDHDQIIERFRQANTRPAAIHVVPIGLDADRSFLADLALRSGGRFAPLDPADPMFADRLGRLFDQAAAVSAHGLQAEVTGIVAGQTLPRVLPQLGSEGCLHVAFDGDLDSGQAVVLRLHGKWSDGAFEQVFTFPVESLAIRPTVGAVWGHAVVEDLLSRERVEGEDLRAELVGEGIAHRVVTPYTSWVITAPKSTDTEDLRLALEEAADLDADGSGVRDADAKQASAGASLARTRTWSYGDASAADASMAQVFDQFAHVPPGQPTAPGALSYASAPGPATAAANPPPLPPGVGTASASAGGPAVGGGSTNATGLRVAPDDVAPAPRHAGIAPLVGALAVAAAAVALAPWRRVRP